MSKSLFPILAVFGLMLSITRCCPAQPYGANGFQGRIALSHDGNFNDEDDWGAFPVAIAILDAVGVKDKLVHIEYNNIIQANDDRFEREMTASVLGAAERYGIPSSILHNCRTDLNGAIESIKNVVNASSHENPLYYVLAGPMDVPYRGILAADPAKRQYVYCVSHSSWNDGYGKRRIEGRSKRDLIALGIHWIQVAPGHALAYSGVPGTKSTPAQWALFHWMRDSRDQRLRWLFTRLEAEERCDVSDATMGYFLVTGDEKCDPKKLAALLDKRQKPEVIAIRPTIRLEAENFSLLENCVPVTVGKQASQNVTVRTSDAPKAILRTEFHEIYAAQSGRYEVGVQYRDANNGAATYVLRINGAPQADEWKASADDNAWKSHVVKGVFLSQGDVIEVEVQGNSKDRGELDFVQLTYLDDGRIRTLMEGTDFHRMTPRNDLKNGSTRYVLASPRREAPLRDGAGSYIAYRNNAMERMGIRNIRAGTYLLRWFDTVDGDTVEQVVAVTAGDQAWPRPPEIGPEAALYVKRLDGVVSPGSK